MPDMLKRADEDQPALSGARIPALRLVRHHLEAMKYRVHYHLNAAGGRLWPTWVELNEDFPDQQAAIKAAEAWSRAQASRERRSHTGYFANARAEPAPTRGATP